MLQEDGQAGTQTKKNMHPITCSEAIQITLSTKKKQTLSQLHTHIDFNQSKTQRKIST